MTAQLDLAGVPGARRVPCRVCAGTCQVPGPNARSSPVPCRFCVGGIAKKVCDACGEALPLCPCFGELRAVAPVTAVAPAEAARRARRRGRAA